MTLGDVLFELLLGVGVAGFGFWLARRRSSAQPSRAPYIEDKVVDRPVPHRSRQQHNDDEDDGFAESFVLAQATGLPVGRNPSGALIGSQLHSSRWSDDSSRDASPRSAGREPTVTNDSDGGSDGGGGGGDGGGD